MQVKKFEASSMKEALVMIKQELGPDAIILSVRDHGRAYGLGGKTSVEVTAAISETQLRKKQVAEAKLTKDLREKYSFASARIQRQFIEKATSTPKAHTDQTLKAQPASVTAADVAGGRPLTTRRYVDITDEPETHDAVRDAAARAVTAATGLEQVASYVPPVAPPKRRQNDVRESEISQLKKEILQLRSLIQDFRSMPQSFLTLHPGAEIGVPYELSPIFDKLIRAGLSAQICKDLMVQVQQALPRERLERQALVEAWVAKTLLERIKIAELRTAARFHAFVGPSGHGKTTMLVKMASQLVIFEKATVAIVAAGNHRIGASEQLKIYAQILNVPFIELKSPADWQLIHQRLGQIQHFLVDYPGMALAQLSQLDQLRSWLPPTEGGRSIHYVQSVLAKESDALELGRRYRQLELDDVMFTKLDESIQHGIIVNFQNEFQLPLHSFGVGPEIPEDFEPATKERVIDLIFKLTSVKKERVNS